MDVVIESFFRPSAICGVQPDGAIVCLALPPDVDICEDIARFLALCPWDYYFLRNTVLKIHLTVGAHNAATPSPTPPPMLDSLWLGSGLTCIVLTLKNVKTWAARGERLHGCGV